MLDSISENITNLENSINNLNNPSKQEIEDLFTEMQAISVDIKNYSDAVFELGNRINHLLNSPEMSFEDVPDLYLHLKSKETEVEVICQQLMDYEDYVGELDNILSSMHKL